MSLSELGWSDWVGIAGAAMGAPALFIQIFQYAYSKPQLRIEVTPECCVLRDEFKVQDDKNPDVSSYRPATHVVITNIGQMAATILGIGIYARNYNWYHRAFRYLPFHKKKQCMTLSNGSMTIDQTYKTPFVLEAGHVWIGIIDTENFRKSLSQFPHVFVEVKPSHKKKAQTKKVKLTTG